MENGIDLPRIPTDLKSGSESFIVRGRDAEFKLLDYWRWAHSDVLTNKARGLMAEFLVAKALGVDDRPRESWEAFDLSSPEGHSIELVREKSSGLQSIFGQTFGLFIALILRGGSGR